MKLITRLMSTIDSPSLCLDRKNSSDAIAVET